MKTKATSGILVTLILFTGLVGALSVPAKAGRYTYDGPWDTDGWVILENTTLTNDVSFADWGIIIDADYVTLDLNGYSVIGSRSDWYVGVRVNGRTGVTIKNGRIEGFRAGIGVYTAYVSGGPHRKSVDVTVEGNIVTHNLGDGIFLNAHNSTVIGNIVTDNRGVGVNISPAAAHNTIKENYISKNKWGINLYGRWPNGWNKIYHNNLIKNKCQAKIDYSQGTPIGNTWDNGYPSGGNYWSDYEGLDLYSGPYQNETGSDEIGDTPYVIDAKHKDNYPLMNPWSTEPPDDRVEAIHELIDTIKSWNLPAGTENSLTSKLEEAILLLNMGNENGAVHKLMDFMNQVEALRDKGELENWQADYLISEAQRIIDLING